MNNRDELMEHIPRLRRYARALIHNRELADDLVQDTLERALCRLHQFEAGTDLRAWLFTVMHNIYASQTRRAASRTHYVEADDDHLGQAEFAVPGGQLRSLEMRDLDYALQRLPAVQREVVLLVGLEEMSYADAALTLGVPIGTVMSRLSRGRDRLRNLMAGAQPVGTLKVVR